MVYRIDHQHFLTHMIDYMTVDELLHFQYFILSAKMTTQDRADNMAKMNIFYPLPEMVAAYAENPNKTIFEAAYFQFLDEHETPDSNTSWSEVTIYKTIINPLIEHADIVIICDENENYIVDAFCKYLEKWHIETIDLNKLFKTGRVGPIHIDRDEIWDAAVDVRRAAGRDLTKSFESSRDGRYKLLRMMSTKEKLKKLKDLGIKVDKTDKKHIDELLIESWVEGEEGQSDSGSVTMW